MLWFSQGCWPDFYFQLEFPPLGSFDPHPQGHFSSSLFPPHLDPCFGIKENSKLRLLYSATVRLVVMLKLLGELIQWAYGDPLGRKTPRWHLLRKLLRSKARPAGNDSRRPCRRAKAVKASPFKGVTGMWTSQPKETPESGRPGHIPWQNTTALARQQAHLHTHPALRQSYSVSLLCRVESTEQSYVYSEPFFTISPLQELWMQWC